LQLDRCGYDPKSSRYGADTSRTEEITQAIVEDIRGPRRKCTNTWEKHRRAVAHGHQLLIAHESSRQAALVTHNDLVMVISTPNSDKIVEDSREKGLICTATLKSNKGLCDKIKCGITTEEHFGPIGLVLCKRHLQMHIDKYKPKPINIVSQIPISVLNDETGDEGRLYGNAQVSFKADHTKDSHVELTLNLNITTVEDAADIRKRARRLSCFTIQFSYFTFIILVSPQLSYCCIYYTHFLLYSSDI
jgi:hypothetical protein